MPGPMQPAGVIKPDLEPQGNVFEHQVCDNCLQHFQQLPSQTMHGHLHQRITLCNKQPTAVLQLSSRQYLLEGGQNIQSFATSSSSSSVFSCLPNWQLQPILMSFSVFQSDSSNRCLSHSSLVWSLQINRVTFPNQAMKPAFHPTLALVLSPDSVESHPLKYKCWNNLSYRFRFRQPLTMFSFFNGFFNCSFCLIFFQTVDFICSFL